MLEIGSLFDPIGTNFMCVLIYYKRMECTLRYQNVSVFHWDIIFMSSSLQSSVGLTKGEVYPWDW